MRISSLGMLVKYDCEVWEKTDYPGIKVIGKGIQKEMLLWIKQPNKTKYQNKPGT